jgi:tellurite methyltransferase
MTDNSHNSANQPVEFLVKYIDLIPTGRALDVAMGRGRNAIYLAKMGFEVEGIDNSPEAVKEALANARAEGVTIWTRVEDLEKIPSVTGESYDLVICFNYLQRSLIPHMKNWIKPGGMLMYETFIVEQARFGKPNNPDFLLKHNELLDMFREFRVLRYREGIIDNRKAIASILAQKV